MDAKKLLLTAGTLVSAVGVVAADCVGKGALCYNATYASTDIAPVTMDVLGSAGIFIRDNVTVIGIFLLLGFIAGSYAKLTHKFGL